MPVFVDCDSQTALIDLQAAEKAITARIHVVIPVHLYIYHLYVVRVNKSCAVDRQLIQEELAVQGIQSGLHYPIPCHLQQAFRHLDYQVGDLSQAETLCQEVLSLPMYPGLSNAQIHQVVAALGPIKNDNFTEILAQKLF